jgi:DNA polymerase-3 subunit chi
MSWVTPLPDILRVALACCLPPAARCLAVTEVWFYHLERTPLEQVLPELLERTLQRGWKALVRTVDAGRLAALDEHLWSFRPDSFLPHGRADEPKAERQPVLLTTDSANLNGANVLFLVDGAEAEGLAGYERCVLLFDGRVELEVAEARRRWAGFRKSGLSVSYWKQGEGGWEKMQ